MTTACFSQTRSRLWWLTSIAGIVLIPGLSPAFSLTDLF